MKKTQFLTLTLFASALTACGPSAREAEVQRCIDSSGNMADEQRCREQQSRPHGGFYPAYRWVYGGNGGYIPGSRVQGYSDSPTPGIEHVPASSLAARGFSEGGARVGIAEGGGFTSAPSARGGFGSIGSGHGSGGGE